MVRHKSYVRKCLQCGKDFVSTRYDAKFDTGACKSKWHRENKDNIITAQSELINAQSEILSDIMPKPKPDSIPKITNGNELFCGDVLREINKMVSDARDAAEADGKFREHWSNYVKDSNRFRHLLHILPETKGYGKSS